MFYFDFIYLLYILPGLVIGLIASYLLRHWTHEYKNVENLNHITGADLVSKIGQINNLKLSLNVVSDDLADNYNPSNHTITLSSDVAYKTTITALAIAAHELGHAIQHQKGSFLMNIRTVLLPVVNIGTNFGYFMIVMGFIFNFFMLSEIGLIFFSASTVLSLITVPLEMDASNKALKFLVTSGSIFSDEISGVKKVLFAAALTYVAALVESIGQVLYFFFRIKRND